MDEGWSDAFDVVTPLVIVFLQIWIGTSRKEG